MRCTNCNTKITSAHYDAEFEIFECPKCGAAFEEDELREAENGSHPRAVPQAKGKKRQAALQDDAAALEKFEEESLKPKQGVETTKHRDEVATGDVLNIFADEIESIWSEFGVKIDRLNAREFFAMNIFRPLAFSGVRFREKEVPHVYCDEHS